MLWMTIQCLTRSWELRASYTPLPCLLNLLTSHVSLHSFQRQPRYIAKHTTRLLNHWRVHMYMSCTGGSRVTVCECRAGCDVAGAGGCQRPLEGQEAACQEGGCSPASSCLQVCTTHNFCTLGNPGWQSMQYALFFAVIQQNDVYCCSIAAYLLSTLPDHTASNITAAKLLEPYDSLTEHGCIMWWALPGPCSNVRCHSAKAVPQSIIGNCSSQLRLQGVPVCSNERS